MHPSLSAYRQFVVYKIVPSATRAGKTDKFPCDYRSGKISNAHDPAIWTDAATAQATALAWGSEYGVGFVFTEADPFWFLDIDECRLGDGTPESPFAWSPLAMQLCTLLAGVYVEISQSGRGLHLIGSGSAPAHACKNQSLGLEFYHTARFVALTGTGAMGDANTDASAVLASLVATYFPSNGPEGESDWTEGPCEGWNGPTDDGDLIRRAMQSKSVGSAFGNKAAFADLWLANESVLSLAYPDPRGRAYGASEADAALAQHLAFWTGKDCARIERLMRQSSLAREKWDTHPTYLRELTITRAIARQVDVMQDKAAPVPPPPAAGATALTERGGDGFMNPAQQLEHFAGCVYVKSQHRALIPGGVLMKPENFKVHYGGYNFHMDAQNAKTTRDAWEAWTQNQIYRCKMVEGICFRPELEPGAIISISGQEFVNTYFPPPVARKAGDVSPFLNHLAKVLPDERDRTILLSYMAACVQHQGIKFQWAPMLQGVEGNGKTMFARCVAEAVGRRYVHWPKASKIAEKFNGWMVGKVFFAVEDIYVPDGRREVIEELKPMITGGDGLEIESKGVDQVSLDICGNFMFNSNHRDAIKKTANDRRFCVLFTAQQQFADLARDGLDNEYMSNLYDWLKADGYAIVAELLHTYAIPAEMNPAGKCQRAPVTSTTHEAIAGSLGKVEQEILEAVDQGLQGFCGGWISALWLERLLEHKRVSISPIKRKEILEQLGYVYHPSLHDGRVNNTVMPDGTKPRLFCRADSLLMQITSAAEVANNYQTANTAKVVVNLPFAASR